MSTISWLTTSPTTQLTASTMDDEIRSTVTAFAVGVGTSFYGPSSAASQGASTSSTGETFLGTARVARGSVADGGSSQNGFLGLDTTRFGLFELGNNTDNRMVGHARQLERVTALGFPQTQIWTQISGTQILSGAGAYAETITYGITFAATPVVIVVPSTASVVAGVFPDVSTAVSRVSYVGPPTPDISVSLYWRAEGPVAIP